jgi:hypothetical protein
MMPWKASDQAPSVQSAAQAATEIKRSFRAVNAEMDFISTFAHLAFQVRQGRSAEIVLGALELARPDQKLPIRELATLV